ncbi:hypothetical protein Q8G35_03875 [Peribacillus simplex]|uniref:Uncharacterized protein n=2 Tax=Peribacillus TaxID=2675229 RepID=A0AA90P782_9BACI|nr:MULTISPECIES: hypothetical protein [Peribacillus]MDP1417543.1 hypothetical protein [Peribacillus simplex]MDP1450198.1 hypothetical protein [Peribacillus frigoritolerans]
MAAEIVSEALADAEKKRMDCSVVVTDMFEVISAGMNSWSVPSDYF